jgi:hypothetical protein
VQLANHVLSGSLLSQQPFDEIVVLIAMCVVSAPLSQSIFKLHPPRRYPSPSSTCYYTNLYSNNLKHAISAQHTNQTYPALKPQSPQLQPTTKPPPLASKNNPGIPHTYPFKSPPHSSLLPSSNYSKSSTTKKQSFHLALSI